MPKMKPETVDRRNRLSELQQLHVDLVVERMNLSKTEDEREKLKFRLRDIREEIEQLGGSWEISSKNASKQKEADKEDWENARKLGERKKKEKKAKKEKQKQMATIAKPKKAKKEK